MRNKIQDSSHIWNLIESGLDQLNSMNLSPYSSQFLYGALLGAFYASDLVKITVPILTSVQFGPNIASKLTINQLLRIWR